MAKNSKKKKMDKPPLAEEAIRLIERIERDFPAEIGKYEQAKAYIKETGNVSELFINSLRSKVNQFKKI